jgi:hypothetical protein
MDAGSLSVKIAGYLISGDTDAAMLIRRPSAAPAITTSTLIHMVENGNKNEI